ncbi:hypothetical protein HDU98_010259 [Podochytrium sp. JEL0797]|nr:hypothetical protein HDU98_010241 [Podochytrium sp. JEL0797]KAJ3076983.1 hypothetical protein HDU98_010259 [Podochytrium sp. JEL0797]
MADWDASQRRAAIDHLMGCLTPIGLGREKEGALWLLRDLASILSTDDKSQLKAVAKNPNEHPYIRGAVIVVIANAEMANGAKASIKRYNDAIGVFDSLCRDQLDQKAWHFPDPEHPHTDNQRTIRELFTLRECWPNVAKKALREMSNPGETDLVDDTPAEDCLHSNPSKPLSDSQHSNLFTVCINRLAGTTCQSCLRKDLPTKKCAGCQAVHYCSRECQNCDWKKGHKSICRPPGVLKTGDLVQVLRLLKATQVNGHFRQVGSFDDAKQRWEVTWVNGSNGLWIKPENLTREEMAEILRK